MRKLLLSLLFLLTIVAANAQQRRPIDSRHPLWMIHIDVWNAADPQRIIDLVPEDIRPFVCMNLSMSCQYDMDRAVYMMPQDAVQTYKSWATVCQHNRLWFTCQPASGGKTHILDTDMDTFEYFFKTYPNFLGWNYCEQFWGFDEAGNRCSSTQESRIALFARLVEMSHKYGGFLTVSFCGNIWSHPLTPNGMLKRNSDLLEACRKYPEACLWLYKYTTTSCWYNTESVCLSPFISGLATNYGVRYDNCGWKGAMDVLFGQNHGHTYPVSAGIGTVMEQSCVNGGAVWDAPETIPTESFMETEKNTVDGYTRRNWAKYPGFDNIWIDMYRKIIDGALYIPTRKEVVEKTKIAVIADVTTGNDEDKYCAWGSLYDLLYKQNDPFNRGNGQWMDNLTWFKSTGRYATIPVCIGMYDDLSKAIPVQKKKSQRWATEYDKQQEFDRLYPSVSTGDLYVSRFRNQLITYTPYTYLNAKKSAKATVPLQYNTCEKLELTFGKLSAGAVREYSDHIDFYLNNYRCDTTTNVLDKIVVYGATSKPTYTLEKRAEAPVEDTETWSAEEGKYTLNIRHCGPVDVCVKCSGANTGRKTDVLPSTALTADLPKQPEAYSGPIIIEAEDMDYKNIGDNVTNPYYLRPDVKGHSGNGFVETGRNTAGSLRHKLTLAKAGNYRIGVKYNSTRKAGQIEVNVNGTAKTAEIQKTAANQWMKTWVEASLNQGENTLYINNANGLDLTLDLIEYRPKDTPVEKYKITVVEGTHGTATPDVTEAAEGDIVTFDIKADEGYKFAGWELHPRQHPYFKDKTMQMPNDNVILQPLFVEGTVTPGGDPVTPGELHEIYSLDFSDVSEGTLPKGWQCLQNGDETHSWPNTYGSGARTFAGFTGFQGKGLYWRSKNAEYGRLTDCQLTLEPGNYRLSFAVAAWKSEPVFDVRILNAGNDAIVAQTADKYSAEPNANGDKSADLSSTETYSFDFKITTKGNYIIQFNNSNGGDWDEFLLLSCKLLTDVSTEVDGIALDADDAPVAIYGEDGRERTSLRHGFNIVKMKSGKTRKIFQY